jgi:hypothetical protein
VLNALNAKSFESMSAEISMIPDAEVALDKDATAKAVKLIEKLEENDDVQNVYSQSGDPRRLRGRIRWPPPPPAARAGASSASTRDWPPWAGAS